MSVPWPAAIGPPSVHWWGGRGGRVAWQGLDGRGARRHPDTLLSIGAKSSDVCAPAARLRLRCQGNGTDGGDGGDGGP